MMTPEYEPLTFAALQDQQAEWLARQPFGDGPSWHPLLGVGEEVGELNHAHLKGVQGIRESSLARKADAVGDIVIYLADYCTREGIDFQAAVESTWNQVRARDWNKDPQGGGVS